MEELDLIQACLKGDRDAQYKLVRMFGPRLLTVCRRYVPNRLDPEDVLQDVFVIIFTRLDQYQGSMGGFWAWIKTIAIHETLKKHRLKEKWHLNRVTIDESLYASDSHDITSHLNAEDLIQMIQSLPDGYREVFNLVAIEGYSHDECAALLGIPNGTSRSTLSRARQILQSQLSQHKIHEL